MKKLSLLLDSRKNEIYLDGFIRTKPNTKMKVKNAAVYWNFKKNVTKIFKDTVTLTSKTITFEEGYWTFHMMAEGLAENDAKLERNRYDNTCKIFSKNDDLNLKNLGSMLGFPKNKIIQANAWTVSPSNVDVNLGLRYVTVEGNTADTDKNFDRHGKKSKVIVTLPVTAEQSLNSSVTHYRDFTSEVAVVNGDHNVFEFFVGTNLKTVVNLKIMLELYLEKLLSLWRTNRRKATERTKKLLRNKN